jgi:hypothetical protein
MGRSIAEHTKSHNIDRPSILCQDVDFAELHLQLLDTFDAIGVCRAVTLVSHDCPAFATRYNSNRD